MARGMIRALSMIPSGVGPDVVVQVVSLIGVLLFQCFALGLVVFLEVSDLLLLLNGGQAGAVLDRVDGRSFIDIEGLQRVLLADLGRRQRGCRLGLGHSLSRGKSGNQEGGQQDQPSEIFHSDSLLIPVYPDYTTSARAGGRVQWPFFSRSSDPGTGS